MKLLYLPNEYSQQRQRQKKAWVYPVRMAMEAEYYRQRGMNVLWDPRYLTSSDYPYDVIQQPEGLPFLDLPAPDRIFTKAMDRKYQRYGNYKYHPATHMIAAAGCWWGKCTFCVEKGLPYEIRPIESVMAEIMEIQAQGFKEVFDDSATFPIGEWLTKFCIQKQIYAPDLVIGCNMRIGAGADFRMMKQAGFRMVLFGVESANQETLNRINKGINAYDTIKDVKDAAAAGLEPHIAVMFGQPGESEREEFETLKTVRYLLRKGYAKTAQASVYAVQGETRRDSKNVRAIYSVAWDAEFWINKLRDVHNFSDFKYLIKAIKKGIIHD